MDYFKTAEVSAAGMAAQKSRLEAATLNLANMHTTQSATGEGFRPVTAVLTAAHPAFSSALEGSERAPTLVKAEIVAQADAAPRLFYDPGHPHADTDGMVAHPAIDHGREMMTVTTALRAYEANLAALQAAKSMATKALEIGGQ